MKSKNIFILAFSVILLSQSSCKKYLTIDPPADQIVNPQPFSNEATATATLSGIYSEMMNSQQQFSSGLTTLYTGMTADELSFYTQGARDEFIINQISESNHSNLSNYFWVPAYKYIYTANLIIDQLGKSAAISADIKKMLIGEAKFIRAFCYFHLINLFGAVPLITSVDYRLNAALPRSPVQDVYSQLTGDLTDAQNSLAINYVTAGRVRPNKYAASALLARVYLYTGDWANAEIISSSIINSGVYTLGTLNTVFQKGSTETIWQLSPVNPSNNTWEGNSILPATANSVPTYSLTNTLISSFEPNDQRKTAWVSSRNYLSQTIFYPSKYKVFGNNAPVTEYYVVFRLAEQYLIRAEARARLSALAGAQSDINVVRHRAGLPDKVFASVAELPAAISQERRIEFFAEWGHRWFDLKRLDQANSILGVLKPTTWQPTDILWPIPVNQIYLNPFLTQNAGY